jgi:hypothetical protein
MSSLNIGDVDPIQRLGRKALLQFVALDYCIHIQAKALAAAILQRSNIQGPVPWSLGNDLLKNPYRLDSNMVTELSDYTTFAPTPTSQMLNILQVFRDYNISIALQQILSHVLINTQRVVEMQSVELEQISGTSESYGTTDQIDNDVLNYYRDIRNSRVKEELEAANFGTPIRGEYEEIIIKLIESIGDLSNQDVENLLQNNMNYIVDELKRERDLLSMVFPMNEEPQLVPDVMTTPGNPLKPNILVDYIQVYRKIINLAGLTGVVDIFDIYLPGDVIGIVNSDIFSAILDYWGHLFTENQPVIINTLTTTLPKISERFVTSITPSISQQDLRYNCLRLIVDYLQQSIKSIRLDEMQNISENPTAANSLVVLRSLRAKQDMLNVPAPANQLIDTQWYMKNDPTGRLGFMFNCWWALTTERELNILFKFAHDIIYVLPPISPDPYGLGTGVIPAAVFPGNLDSSSVLENSKSLIDLDYENDKRRIRIKEEKLKRFGELEKVLISEGGRWFI